ncbi:PREDICTED: protein FAM204A-like [Priapulus caudatus]|uniref:Protein FAM204A-like n=1 Tax=Priapulus caudatus TaxID=37621 RepID=A0ABM1DVV3_PRICU|nr:PREDICTED: protein FAM204A-like [Priapulus caudatus]
MMDKKHPPIIGGSVTVSVSQNASETKRPAEMPTMASGVSQEMKEKFESLRKRRELISKRSTEKRICELKRKVSEIVRKELSDPEDRLIVEGCDVSLQDRDVSNKKTCIEQQQQQHKQQQGRNGVPSDQLSHLLQSPHNKSSHQTLPSTELASWVSEPKTSSEQVTLRGDNKRLCIQDVAKYVGLNDRLKDVDHGRYGPKTKLEQRIDEAISREDFHLAERLSDHLADRQKEDESKPSKYRKKKLKWTFSKKERWETKSAM